MTNTNSAPSLGRAAAKGVNGLTKSQCHCGRPMCSDARAMQRRTQRRLERRAFRAELRDLAFA